MKTLLILLGATLAFPVAAFEAKLGQPISEPSGLITFVLNISDWVFGAIIALSVLFVLMAAWEYLTNGSEGVEKAHKMLLYAVIAIAVAVLSRGIVSVAARLAGQPAGQILPEVRTNN